MNRSSWFTRTRVIAAAAAIMVVAAGTILGTRALTSGQEPGTRVEVRATGPSGQQGPVNVQVPNYPSNPGPAVIWGPYRILPYGWRDPSEPARTPVGPATCATPTSRVPQQVLEASPLYMRVGYVPAAFQSGLQVQAFACGDQVRGIKWTFRGSLAGTIEIVRRYADLPVDVLAPPADGTVTLEKATVGGLPAILLRPKPGLGGAELYLVRGTITTHVLAAVNDTSELIRVVESFR